jgi:hypothetical protein
MATHASACIRCDRVDGFPCLLGAKSERGVQIFKQAFLGRLIVVTYYPISDTVMRQIIRRTMPAAATSASTQPIFL